MRAIPSRSSTSPDLLHPFHSPRLQNGSAGVPHADLATKASLDGASAVRRRSRPRLVDEASPRDMDQRIPHTRTRLELDVDVWVATSGPDRPWLIP